MASDPHAPLPAFQQLVSQRLPQGVAIRPRSIAASWLIEMVVWLVATAGAASLIMYSQVPWQRVLGGIAVVPIGIRALMRTIRFVSSQWLRTLSVLWNVPRPLIAGPFARTTLDSVTRFDVARHQNDLYFDAIDVQGKATHLVTLEPREEADYRALGEWILARGLNR